MKKIKKYCNFCRKLMAVAQNSQRYHPECFLKHRFEYQQKWWKAKRTVRETYFTLEKKLREMEKKI